MGLFTEGVSKILKEGLILAFRDMGGATDTDDNATAMEKLKKKIGDKSKKIVKSSIYAN